VCGDEDVRQPSLSTSSHLLKFIRCFEFLCAHWKVSCTATLSFCLYQLKIDSQVVISSMSGQQIGVCTNFLNLYFQKLLVLLGSFTILQCCG